MTTEGNRQAWSALPLPTRSMFKQHRGAGPSRRQKKGESDAGFPSVSDGVANDSAYRDSEYIRKGQVKWLAKDDLPGQAALVGHLFGLTHAA